MCCSWTATPTGRHRLTPDGCADLLWLNSGRLILCGPERHSWTFELPPNTEAVGVRFRPGALHSVFGLDVSTVANRVLPFAAALDDATTAARWAGTVAAAPTQTARHDVLRGLSAAACRGRSLPTGAQTVLDLLAARPGATTAELAKATALPLRTLLRSATRWFGYGTATLARIMRLQRFLAAAATSPATASLAALAASAGYSDSAHLARDCRSITGLSPSALLAEHFPTFPDVADPYKTARPLLATMA